MHRGPKAEEVGPIVAWMRTKLRRLTRGHGDAAVALRARMVLMLVDDPCVSRVAERLGVDRATVRMWRDRFLKNGVKGLFDKRRSGRPRVISDVDRCALIAMACGRPKEFGIEFRRTWTTDDLHAAFRTRHPTVSISRTSVLRILNGSDLRPHRMQVWLHSPDPDFRAKANAICDLYLRPPKGVTLCIDEKTGMQALSRRFATKWPTVGRWGRREFEYKRHGTATLFAAFEVGTGRVYGEVRKKRKGADLLAFMEAVAREYPTGDVHIVWDNLNIHYDGADERWTRFNARHGGRFHFHYTPIHASWLNQVELFFSRVERRVLRNASFTSVQHLTTEVLGYIAHWNARERKPYRWKFRGFPLELVKRAA